MPGGGRGAGFRSETLLRVGLWREMSQAGCLWHFGNAARVGNWQVNGWRGSRAEEKDRVLGKLWLCGAEVNNETDLLRACGPLRACDRPLRAYETELFGP